MADEEPELVVVVNGLKDEEEVVVVEVFVVNGLKDEEELVVVVVVVGANGLKDEDDAEGIGAAAAAPPWAGAMKGF